MHHFLREPRAEGTSALTHDSNPTYNLKGVSILKNITCFSLRKNLWKISASQSTQEAKRQEGQSCVRDGSCLKCLAPAEIGSGFHRLGGARSINKVTSRTLPVMNGNALRWSVYVSEIFPAQWSTRAQKANDCITV